MMDDHLDHELDARLQLQSHSQQQTHHHQASSPSTTTGNSQQRNHRHRQQQQRIHNLHSLYHPYHSRDVKMNLQSLFQEFNLSKFIVYSCLLIFSMLFALRLDGSINWSYWTVFLPLWIWKTIVVSGGMIGTIVWARNPDYRLSEQSYISFKSMLISLSLQLLLLMFELLVCDKLESGRHLWTLAFIPLLFVSLLSVAITVWSLKNERAFELELFCAVNVLQFLFIALRLDNLLNWSWVVVFVPFWVLITMALIGVLYALIFAAILLRTPDIAADTRRASFHSAVSYSLVVLPLMIFLVLLSNKLDYGINGGGFLWQQQQLESLWIIFSSLSIPFSPSSTSFLFISSGSLSLFSHNILSCFKFLAVFFDPTIGVSNCVINKHDCSSLIPSPPSSSFNIPCFSIFSSSSCSGCCCSIELLCCLLSSLFSFCHPHWIVFWIKRRQYV